MAGWADPAGDQEQVGLGLTAGGPEMGGNAADQTATATGEAGVLPPEDSADPDDAPVADDLHATPVGAAIEEHQSQSTPSIPDVPPATGVPGSGPQGAAEWLDATCPYLRSTDGTWRSVVPQRGQLCWGQAPPAPLEPSTQERLCSTSAHATCEIFVAAEQRHVDALTRDHVAPERLDGRFGVMVRPSTLVLEDSGSARVQLPVRVPVAQRTRVGIGLGLAGAVVLVALLAGLAGGGAPASTQPPPIAFVSPSPVPPTSPPATAAPLPSATIPPPTQPAPTPTPAPPSATPAPPSSPSPRPAIRTTYRVHKGDTLAKIAAQFGVTKKQILAVNDFGNPPHLRYGTTINIPYP